MESEKTAIIASVWMAVGALSWLNIKKLEPLRGRQIVLYPDASVDGKAFEMWNKVAHEARQLSYSISVSDLLERDCTNRRKVDGYDIGDYLIDRLVRPKSSERQAVDVLQSMIERNPSLAILIEGLGLVRV